MNNELLEEILSCPSLPSLPAVALRVIEQTSDANVKLPELAATIQNDQGLAAKVLRTVNSSFYGLRTRCSTINKALVMLGLGPVKALALGFSLVSALEKKEGDEAFDYTAYWRRGLYSAVAAKCVAEAARRPWADEAFLGGLLQDVGSLAMYRAMKSQYKDVLKQTNGDHRKLVKNELATFEIQHPDIGAMLCQRWKFPMELVLPVKYHERPTAAPKDCAEIVRAVGLGNYAHDALTDSDPAPALKRFYERCKEWFGLDADEVEKVLRRIVDGTKEMSQLFKLNTGPSADADKLLEVAGQQLTAVAKLPAPDGIRGMDSLLVNASEIDPLTGLVGRSGFDSAVRNGVDLAKNNSESFSLLNVCLDGAKAIVAAKGQVGLDDAVTAIGAALCKSFLPMGGVVCRLSAEIFAVVMLGTGQVEAGKATNEFLKDFERLQREWGVPQARAALGLASVSAEQAKLVEKVDELVIAMVRAAQESRANGGNRVCIHHPTRAAA
ncbi:MAG: HDOD domain-containing protein [Planctomycetota bacterium]|nr:HDOD domain-containing protein [Planctomycetota bacterium]